jgi:outer membrane murein-binding lipoprotein Lpp
MDMLDASTMLLAVLFIQGCSSAVQPPDASAPPPPTKTVFDPLTQDLQKARGVQKTVEEQAARAGNGIDSQERGDSPQ